MKLETKSPWLVARLITLARVYFTFLFGWAILHALFGDRWAWLFLLNSFAEYFFLPLPAIFIVAIAVRRREVWIGLVAATVLTAFLYGGLFVPKVALRRANSPILTVMSFNMFGFNEHPDAVITALRAANADVIAIQELNPPAADAIRRDLTREFPYQILDSHEETIGSGVISRYPLRASDETLPGSWVGTPQVLMLDWQGTAVTLLHIHAIPTNFSPREFLWSADIVEWTLRERERQAHAIVDFARAHPGPLIVVGDFNAGDQSTAYAIVTNALIDSWREAGWGLGHTFLGGNPGEGTHPTMAGIAMPLWLLRIDYVFHSHHWQAVSAEVGPWDGFSDHRSVVVRLRYGRGICSNASVRQIQGFIGQSRSWCTRDLANASPLQTRHFRRAFAFSAKRNRIGTTFRETPCRQP